MKNPLFALLILFALATIQSCNLIGDIFRFGMWSGIIVVVLIVIIVIYIVSRIRKRF